jgi:hypothetical protein
MQSKIQQKIEEWIEEDVNNLDGYFGYTDSSEFLLKGYNQALQDLRTKAPQLTEEIVRVVVGEIEKRQKSFSTEEFRDGNYVIEEIINLLKK